MSRISGIFYKKEKSVFIIKINIQHQCRRMIINHINYEFIKYISLLAHVLLLGVVWIGKCHQQKNYGLDVNLKYLLCQDIVHVHVPSPEFACGSKV
jgi:hypothetical protein